MSPRRAALPARIDRALAYVFAVLLAVLLVAALAVPLGIAILRYRGDWPPAASGGGPPTTATGGATGRRSLLPRLRQQRLRRDAVHNHGRLGSRRRDAHRPHRRGARATEDLASSTSISPCRPTGSGSTTSTPPSTLEGFQDLRITPASPDRGRRRFTVTVEYAGRPGKLQREGMDEPPWWTGERRVDRRRRTRERRPGGIPPTTTRPTPR